MNNLIVRVQQDLDGDELRDNGVVANILYVGGESPQAGQEKSRRDVVIPVNGNPESIHLEPGQYVLQATLPTGELIIRDFRIPEDGADVSIELESSLVSPHEWLRWHTFIGNVQTVPEAAEAQPAPPFSLGYSGFRMRFLKLPGDLPYETLPSPAPARELSQLAARLVTAEVETLKGPTVWTALGELIAHPGPPGAAQDMIGGAAVQPAGSDSAFSLYRFSGEGPVPVMEPPVHPVDYVGHDLLRQYLTLSSPNSLKLVCLPVPWPQIDHSGEAVVELVVPAMGAPDVIDSNIAIRDREVGSALGYLTRGDRTSASTLFARARGMLFEKLTNPIGAAIGGYVLLSTDLPGGAWMQWIKNLKNWFEWLPDGAILYAWMKVEHQERDEDLDEAREAVMLAYQRGLPFCSLGMGKLMELLRLFADDDADCREALSAVQRVAWRTDMGEPFTMIDVMRDVS